MKKPQQSLRDFVRSPLFILIISIDLVILAVLAIFLYLPIAPIVSPEVEPLTKYGQIVEAIHNEQLREKDIVHPDCVSKFLTHGTKTDRAIVMLHGYTSCPAQFRELAEKFFDAGYNVYVPRAPYHGYKDRLTEHIAELTTEQYIRYAQTSIATVAGLGEKLTVAGFSGGAVLTTWAAQNVQYIDTAMIISPAIGLQAVPEWIIVPVIKLYDILPQEFRWWNEQEKEQGALSYDYPKFSVQVLARIVRIGRSILDGSTVKPPKATHVIFIKNDGDMSVTKEPIEKLEQNWKNLVGDNITSYTFGKELGLTHPFIDPTYAGIHKEKIYATILELADRPVAID